MSKSDKPTNAKLDAAIASICKDFGAGAIIKLGSDQRQEVERFGTGSVKLDRALSGGFPRGRIVEIYGPESSGKSSLALLSAAELQKAGELVAYIDMEHAIDKEYAEKLGVNVNDLFFSQPDTAEDVFTIVEKLVESDSFGLIVIDSVAALIPRAELEGDFGDSNMGLQARLMSQALRKLSAKVDKTQTTIIFINQLRSKIGVMFGNPETTTGGNALKFWASLRLDIRRVDYIKQKKDGSLTQDKEDKDAEIIGQTVKVKVAKSKTSPPLRKVEFVMPFGAPISCEGEIIDLATELNFLEKSGAWYKFNGANVAQGREKGIVWLRENPEVKNDLLEKIKSV